MNPKTNMSSLRPPHFSIPPVTFPSVSAQPSNLPIRLDPQLPALATLDAQYELTDHPILDSKIKALDEDETRNDNAMRILENHIRDRMPFVQLASSRLQSVMGTRNERVFDLPIVDRSGLSPTLRDLYEIPEGSLLATGGSLDAGSKALAFAIGGGSFGGEMKKESKKQRGIGAMFSPKSPLGPGVDKMTGVGLREFLLVKGKEGRMRKRECGSITICDFTPGMSSTEHRNKLLGHWSGDKSKGERVDVYEVDLQTSSINIETGEESPVTETWIWFLISRPILSLSASDTSTTIRPYRSSPDLSENVDLDNFHTPPSKYAPSPSPTPPSANPQPPPNFPHPIPSSWLVFACPLEHVTSYPIIVEKVADEDKSTTPTPSPTPNLPFFPNPPTLEKQFHKRADYDFSHYGIPIFEFSSSTLFKHRTTKMDFLSVDDIGGWDEKDFYNQYTEAEYNEILAEREDLLVGQENEYGDEMGMDLPSPNRGIWWEKFYEGMYKDKRRWESIKHAMGRGKCRVVIRWAESESKQREEGKDEVMGGMNAGERGIGLGIKGEFMGTRGKSKSKEKGSAGTRLRSTRSDIRRRSALGLEVMSASMNGGPVGGAEGAASVSKTRREEKLKVRKR